MRKASGITIVEVVVAIGLASIVAIGLMPLLLHTLTGSTQASVEASLQHKANSALSTVSLNIARSQSLLSTPDHSNTTPPATEGWTASSSTLITRQVATTRAPQDSSRQPVYTGTGGTNNCTTERNPVFINQVYYVHNNTLYQRTIVPSLAGTCNNVSIHQKTTCLTCTVKDVPLANHVNSFSVTYEPESPDPDNPYDGTEMVRMSLELESSTYRHTSHHVARLMLAGKSIGSN